MRFLFVGGSQRSGTTLLQKLLCLSPAATPKLAEASYLRMLMQAYVQAKVDFEHDTSSYFDDVEDLRQFHTGFVHAFLNRTLARCDGASTLILKEPHLTQLFPQLFELVPESRYVLIMRDPRDIMASMISVGERMAAQGQQHFFQQRDIAQLSNLIKSFYAPTLNNQDQTYRSRTLVIRYEDLIQNTADLRTTLAGFTGLDLNVDESGIATPREDKDQPRYQPWYTDNSERDINASSIGRYKQVLTAQEIETAENTCSDIIELFHY